jgi:hypothetical protein
MSTYNEFEGAKLIKDPTNKIRKKTIIANVLVAIALPFFAYYLGYKNSNWLLEFVCLMFFLLVVYNALKYLFKKDYRRNFNEYQDSQKGLLYQTVYSKEIIFFAMMLYLITIFTGIILNFFNLL